MREACSCGAEVRTWSRSYALAWRTAHLHDMPEQDGEGPAGTEAFTERIHQPRFIGFVPEDEIPREWATDDRAPNTSHLHR